MFFEIDVSVDCQTEKNIETIQNSSGMLEFEFCVITQGISVVNLMHEDYNGPMLWSIKCRRKLIHDRNKFSELQENRKYAKDISLVLSSLWVYVRIHTHYYIKVNV